LSSLWNEAKAPSLPTAGLFSEDGGIDVCIVQKESRSLKASQEAAPEQK
jgi:hypothetical protein